MRDSSPQPARSEALRKRLIRQATMLQEVAEGMTPGAVPAEVKAVQVLTDAVADAIGVYEKAPLH